jgi:hypothetical protein
MIIQEYVSFRTNSVSLENPAPRLILRGLTNNKILRQLFTLFQSPQDDINWGSKARFHSRTLLGGSGGTCKGDRPVAPTRDFIPVYCRIEMINAFDNCLPHFRLTLLMHVEREVVVTSGVFTS